MAIGKEPGENVWYRNMKSIKTIIYASAGLFFLLSGSCLHDRDNPNDPGADNNYVEGIAGFNISHDSVDIIDSSVFDMGNVTVNESMDAVFTIENTGDAYLNLTKMQITSSAQFSVITSPVTPVIPGGSTFFTIRFIPDDEADFLVNVYIYYFDTESRTFVFTIHGTGIY